MAPAMTDIISGETDFIIATAPVALPYIRDNQVTALAVASSARASVFPEIGTFAEQGYPGVVADDVYGLVAPKGLPAPLLNVLHHEITTIVRTDAFASRLTPLALSALPMDTPQAYGDFLRDDYAKWRGVIERNHIAQQ